MYKFKLFVFILLIVFILFSAYKKFDSCADATEGYKVGLKEVTYNDANRNRQLKTAIWYPVNNSENTECISHSIWKVGSVAKNTEILPTKLKYPLILFSHGYSGDRWCNSWFAKFLASKGYIVVTMDHWGNTYDNMIAKWSIRPYERARDINFVLDQLLIDPNWSEKIDQNKIGVAGYSQGGAAALLVAGAQTEYASLYDDYEKESDEEKKILHSMFKHQDEYIRELKNFDYKVANGSFKNSKVKAVFSMAPGLDEKFVYFKSNGFDNVNIPVFIVAGDSDDIILPEINAKFYASKIKNSQIKILPNVTHWVFLNPGTVVGKALKPLLTIDSSLVDRAKIHETVGNWALNFFNENLK